MQPAARFPQLDALRGVAALWVFFHHSFMMMPVMPLWLEKIQYTPLNFFCDGGAAVTLFFVLSGLVLNLKYSRPGAFTPRWASIFIINRIFRIYPAFLAVILLSLFFRYFLYVPSVMDAMAPEFAGHWRNPLNVPDLLKLITLVLPGIHPEQIDPPMWSLVFEMRVSLLFPLIIFCLARQWKIAGDLIFLAAVYLICFTFKEETILCIPYFALGAVCAKYFDGFRSRLGKLNPALQFLWLVASLLLYEAGSMTANDPLMGRYSSYICHQLIGLGAAGIILASVSFKAMAKCLSSRPFQFIGMTSYSFYLIHMLFQLTPAPMVYHLTHSWTATWLTALVLTYLAAWLPFTFIEKPMIKQGHSLGDWLVKSPETIPQISAK